MPSNNNNDQTEADNVTTQTSSGSLVSSTFRATIERTALSHKGKDRYQYLLDRKIKELDALHTLKSDKKATYYTIPATRLQRERCESLENELTEIDESISVVDTQIQTLQQRVQSYEQTGQPWSTPGRPTASTVSQEARASISAAQSSAPAENPSTPAPRRLFTDPFSNRAEEPSELNPKQFIVPTNLLTFRHEDSANQDVDTFIRQFELTLNAHGLSHDRVWSRLLPLCPV